MTVIDNAELGRRLREYRQRQGVTIEQAAAHLGGVDPSVVSKMETGKRNIDAIELAQLTVLYGVTFDVLLDTGREICPTCAGDGDCGRDAPGRGEGSGMSLTVFSYGGGVQSNAAKTRRRKQIDAGQQTLFSEACEGGQS